VGGSVNNDGDGEMIMTCRLICISGGGVVVVA
jgi:hypothetical protein